MLELQPTKLDADALQLRALLDEFLAGKVEAAFIAVRDRHGQVRYVSIGTSPAVLPYNSPSVSHKSRAPS